MRSIVVAHQVRELMGPGGKAYGLNGEQAWRGTLAGATAAEEAARFAGDCDPVLAFTAGLCRDCGKLAIDSLPGSAQDHVLRTDSHDHLQLLEAKGL